MLLDEAVGVDDFMTWSEWALKRVGFRPVNALPLAALCRDELMGDVNEAIARTWGRPFQLGSLAGLPMLGRTGLQAALGHVPGEDGRHRFAAFVLPHIGIDADGRLGRVQRRGMYRASSACGALVGLRAQLLDGTVEVTLDPDDAEQSLLRQRLVRELRTDEVPSLLGLTDLTRQAAVADLRRFIDLARANEPVDVAYLSGIVVHLPDGNDVIANVHAHVEIESDTIPLPH